MVRGQIVRTAAPHRRKLKGSNNESNRSRLCLTSHARGSGAATLFDTLALSGSNFAFDFNPTNANLRIVSNNNSNYVRNFTSGALVNGANVAYRAGPLMGVDPDITGAAYTFKDNNPATGTTLFVIDSRNDMLATQNAATGVLTRIGDLGTNVGARTSFDIVSHSGKNFGYAQSANWLYKVDLASGALTKAGMTDRSLFALTASVPEPVTWAMLLIGFGMVGVAARKRTPASVSA